MKQWLHTHFRWTQTFQRGGSPTCKCRTLSERHPEFNLFSVAAASANRTPVARPCACFRGSGTELFLCEPLVTSQSFQRARHDVTVRRRTRHFAAWDHQLRTLFRDAWGSHHCLVPDRSSEEGCLIVCRPGLGREAWPGRERKLRQAAAPAKLQKYTLPAWENHVVKEVHFGSVGSTRRSFSMQV